MPHLHSSRFIGGNPEFSVGDGPSSAGCVDGDLACSSTATVHSCGVAIGPSALIVEAKLMPAAVDAASFSA